MTGLSISTAEIACVRKSWMRADRDVVSSGQCRSPAHELRISGMHPAGDIDRRNQRHELGFTGQKLRTLVLAHVTVQINSLHGFARY